MGWSFNSAALGYEKPHRRIFELALEAMDRPRYAWMVGDNIRADVLGAQAAGIPGILVRGCHPKSLRSWPDLAAAGQLILETIEWEALMTYRLLASDIDGTLLDSKGKLTERVVEAVRAARNSGMQVCLVTGRRPRSTVGICTALGLEGPIISFNGGVIADPVMLRSLRVVTIPREAVSGLLLAWHDEGLSAFAYRDSAVPLDVYYALAPTWARMAEYVAREGANMTRIPCLVRGTDWEPVRLMVGDSEERTLAASQLAQPHLDPARVRIFHLVPLTPGELPGFLRAMVLLRAEFWTLKDRIPPGAGTGPSRTGRPSGSSWPTWRPATAGI